MSKKKDPIYNLIKDAFSKLSDGIIFLDTVALSGFSRDDFFVLYNRARQKTGEKERKANGRKLLDWLRFAERYFSYLTKLAEENKILFTGKIKNEILEFKKGLESCIEESKSEGSNSYYNYKFNWSKPNVRNIKKVRIHVKKEGKREVYTKPYLHQIRTVKNKLDYFLSSVKVIDKNSFQDLSMKEKTGIEKTIEIINKPLSALGKTLSEADRELIQLSTSYSKENPKDDTYLLSRDRGIASTICLLFDMNKLKQNFKLVQIRPRKNLGDFFFDFIDINSFNKPKKSEIYQIGTIKEYLNEYFNKTKNNIMQYGMQHSIK